MTMKNKKGWTLDPVKLARTGYDAVRMIIAWIRGEYPRVPIATLLALVMGALYFVVPTDVIPDFLIGTGWLDDAVVIGVLLNLISNDVGKFREWKNTGEKVIDAEYWVVEDEDNVAPRPLHR